MTTETRITVEFSDIVRVEFECPKCHARTNREVSSNNILPTRCKGGVCGQVFFAEGSSEMTYLQAALDLIGRYAKAKDSAFILRFELKPPNSPPLKQAQ